MAANTLAGRLTLRCGRHLHGIMAHGRLRRCFDALKLMRRVAGGVERQQHKEHRTLRPALLHLYGAVVQIHHLAGEVQANTRAGRRRPRMVVDLIEAVEYTVETVGGDARACVTHPYGEESTLHSHAETYAAARRRKFESVRKNVEHHLVDLVGIERHRFGHICRKLYREVHILAPRHIGESAGKLFHKGPHGHGLHGERHLVVVEAPQIHYLVYQAQNTSAVLPHHIDSVQHLLVACILAQRLQRSQYHGERSAYLM